MGKRSSHGVSFSHIRIACPVEDSHRKLSMSRLLDHSEQATRCDTVYSDAFRLFEVTASFLYTFIRLHYITCVPEGSGGVCMLK